ncbi:MAG: hypothetical protein EZS28_020939 [Streblomastix strix]|uniref:Uncharacterized protein n=1 Tax=Streblomastix strix TaxID=222440 RepID=A0A5J4VM67_9EUKA|nr:MAG: hypothetical protein EZS28_020939 [Streblomastix strix]
MHYQISQICTGDIYLSNYYSKTEADELIDDKVDTTDLADYFTLGTSQTVTARKTFINSYKFVGSIDEMSTATGLSFLKSYANNTVVLLGADEVDSKLTNYMHIANNQSINGTQALNAIINATKFVKTEKDDSSVLLGGGVDNTIAPPAPPNTTYLISLATK